MIEPKPLGDGFGIDFTLSSGHVLTSILFTMIMCGTIKKFTLVLVVFLAGQWAMAQVLVSGKVLDQQSGEALPGVSISVINSAMGTVTDINGEFSFDLQDPSMLLSFTSLGYITQKIQAGKLPHRVILEPSLLDLAQVVVSAGGGRQLRTDAPIAISKISPRMLEEAKAASLEQVINKVHGVYMVNLGNEQHSMGIRQPLTVKSLFLYLEDGIPLRPTGIYNHNALIEMNMAALGSIEVIKGPASSIYGSEAIGGSINFISKIPPEEATAKIGIQGDNLGYKRLDFDVGNTFGQTGLYAAGYYANRRNGYREHSDFHKLAFNVAANYKLGERDNLTATLAVTDYHTDMTGAIDSTDFYSKSYPSMHTFTYRKVKSLRLRSTWDHFWNDKSKTSFNLIYRDNLMGQNPAYRVRNNPQNPAKASGEINEQTFQSYGAIIRHLQEMDWLDARLVGGLSLDYSPSQFMAEFIDVDRDEQGHYADYHRIDSLLTHYRVNLLNSAAFAQLEFSPIQKLKLILAARYDHFQYDYQNYLTPDAFSGAPDAVNSFNYLSPKVGFTYDVLQGKGFYGNYSVGFAPPQVSELYRGVKVPVLEPSLYHNYELGGWWNFGERISLDFSLYQLDGTNEIINVYLDDGTTENRNAGQTLHQGIEYSINYSPVSQLKFRFGGANSRHEYVDYVESGNSYNGKKMESAPAWIANSEVFYYPQILKGLRIGLEWQRMSSYYMDPANTERYEGFNVFNVRLGYEKDRLDTWINLLNTTDELYATNASKSRFGKSYSPGDPRSISIGLAFRLIKN